VIAVPADLVVIGLGGNVGDEPAITACFRRAREAFEQIAPVRSAALYRTAAVGPAQPAFLNTAISVRWPDAIASEIMQTVLELEQLLGRDRRGEERWGPRAIDLDVLVWGARHARWDGPPALEVPHPRLVERRFALAPLGDLLGEDVIVAGAKVGVGELYRALTEQVVERIADRW
jgi:2-amino-4-hydroxy-6-hydroxymethyldihydropteridine diphosphokinase